MVARRWRLATFALVCKRLKKAKARLILSILPGVASLISDTASRTGSGKQLNVILIDVGSSDDIAAFIIVYAS